MTRRVRLTLASVAVVALLATAISAAYLKTQVDKEFDLVLEAADRAKETAARAVVRSADAQTGQIDVAGLADDADLRQTFGDVLVTSKSLIDVAVTGADGRLIAGYDPVRKPGDAYPVGHPDYRDFVRNRGTWDKVRMLFFQDTPSYFQLTRGLGFEEDGKSETLLWVRVVVYPALIREAVQYDLQRTVLFSIAAVAGSALVALLFSSYAFRPLAQVSEMLDQIARGDYKAQDGAPVSDEFGKVLSKVDLLGQRLGEVDRLLDEMEEAVIGFAQDGSTVVVTGAVEKFLGTKRAALATQRRDELFPPDTPIGFVVGQAIDNSKPVRNLRLALPGGAGMPFALVSIELLTPSGVLVRLRDPDARQQIQGQLQTAERLSAISRVTRGVAHEVKNPLNAILMHVDLARMKVTRGDTEIAPHMDIIEKEILRLDRVVKTFLDFARPAEVRLEDLVVDDLIRELADLARPQAAAANVEVHAELAAPDTSISADPDLFRQALLNLVVNAIEAMPGGGTLTFSTRIDGGEVEIAIADTGTGIPADLREQIFQLYFTTKEEGSGIGLALAYRTIQTHGATMDFESEPGKGTKFCIRFPLERTA